ncbi:MAG: RIP metalloprotease RseP [Bdellovibrionales bacterium]
MEILTGYLQEGVSFVVPLVILLGLLIFVHELGHFAVAKYFGVRVEVFSLGFGKKIFKFRRGDTEYCLSIIPLGGYVKMFGDDPKAPIEENQKQFSFNHKPVGQRIGIVLAGPLMNLFFAFFLFIAIAIVGEMVLLPRLGDIEENTAAHQAGFRSGDSILKVNGQPVAKWDDVDQMIKSSIGKNLEFEISRYPNGNVEKVVATPASAPNKNVISSEQVVGDIEGLVYYSKASVVGLQDPTSLAGAAGFITGDIITSVNGAAVERWIDLERIILEQKNKKSFIFEIERGFEKTEKKTVEIALADIESATSGQNALERLGLLPADLFISKVVNDSAASEAGLREGDKIISINDTKILNWTQLVGIVRSYKDGESAPLNVVVLRDGTERSYKIAPRKVKQMAPTGKEEESYAIGVQPTIANAAPSTFLENTKDPIKAISIGAVNSWVWTKTICLSFLRLFQARVSVKSIGGPIMIGQLAKETFKIGLSPFLKIMAIISINLFVLNLLPVPVLDGGHLVFFTVEALRGAPLSMQKMEMAQQVGLVLLLGLMVIALYNDISRVIGL